MKNNLTYRHDKSGCGQIVPENSASPLTAYLLESTVLIQAGRYCVVGAEGGGDQVHVGGVQGGVNCIQAGGVCFGGVQGGGDWVHDGHI